MKLGTKISRLAFLRLMLVSSIGAGVYLLNEYAKSKSQGIGSATYLRAMMRGAALRYFSANERVALGACASYEADILTPLREAWRNANLPNLSGLRVVLKPNLVDFVEGFPSFTHPRVTQAMIQLAREQGARSVVVAEGPTFRRDSQAVFNATGYADMLAREKVDFVDLNYDDLGTFPLKGGYTGLKTMFVARTILDADLFVSMPKLKTHHWSQMSASIKNLFGIVPGIKYGWPKNTLHVQGVSEFLTELADSLPTRHCAVVDGVTGMQGDGPLFGTAVPSGVLIVGNDLVAVDATCARLMGLDPAQIEYLAYASSFGVGTIASEKIDVVGEPLSKLQRVFERPPQL